MTRPLKDWTCIVLMSTVLLAAHAVSAPAFAGDNLLVNGDGATGDMTGWTITANGGGGWQVIEGEFTTSYKWARRTQTIDLLSSGFSAEQLDQAPQIVIAQDVRYTYCPDRYAIKVELLDATQTPVAVFDTGIVRQTGTCTSNAPWETVTHTFKHYGAGVRYIRWEDGGEKTGGDSTARPLIMPAWKSLSRRDLRPTCC